MNQQSRRPFARLLTSQLAPIRGTFIQSMVICTAESIHNVLGLFKERSQIFDEFSSETIHNTNLLLKSGLIQELLQDLKALCRSNDIASNRSQWGLGARKSEVLFYICISTQLELSEATELNRLVKDASDRIDSSKHTADQCDVDTLLQILVNLHMCQICAFQQTEKILLKRDVEYTQETLNMIASENDLRVTSDSRLEMDSNSWGNSGAQGFTNLVLAVFREPDVDDTIAKPEVVKWHLHEACIHRAFSYIRKCIIPIVHSLGLIDNFRALAYLKIIAKFLENLAKIFVMSHYKNADPNEDADFPYDLFPPTASFYSASRGYFTRLQIENGHTNIPKNHRGAVPQNGISNSVDTLKEVLQLFSEVVDIYPKFSTTFWPDSDSSLDGSPDHGSRGRHEYHPFVVKAINVCSYHDSLLISGIQFVTSLAKSGGSTGATLVFQFLKHSNYWSAWMDRFDRIKDALAGNEDTSRMQLTGALSHSVNQISNAINRAMQTTSIFRSVTPDTPILAQSDFHDLLGILQLIAAVARCPTVANSLVDELQKFFVVISSSVSVDIKAAAFDCISSIASHWQEVSNRVWEFMEVYSLFPIRSSSSSSERGLAWEFAEIETKSGKFTMTMSFMRLLSTILQFGIPDDLGNAYRIPGIGAYLDFVIEEVLLKAHDRAYNSELGEVDSLGLRWKVTALALEVLQAVLTGYKLLEVDGDIADQMRRLSEELPYADFFDEEFECIVDGKPIRTARPKSAGFYVLAMLLGNSRTTELLLNILMYLNETYLTNQVVNYVNTVLGMTRRQLYEKFSSNPVQLPGALVTGNASGEIRSTSIYSTSYSLARTNSVYWIERTLACAVWILHEMSAKERVFHALHEGSGVPIVIRKREFGRLVQIPVVPNRVSRIIVGNNVVSALLNLVCQKFSCLPSNPPIEVLTLKLLQRILVEVPNFAFVGTRTMEGTESLVDIERITKCYDLLLQEYSQSVDQIGDSGEYTIMYDCLSRKPLMWSSSLAFGFQEKEAHESLLRSEIINLFLFPLDPSRLSLVHQLLGMQHRAGSKQPCLSSILSLLNPKGHQLLLRSPKEAADCYELIYRLCSSPLTSTRTFTYLHDHAVDYFEMQWSFFSLIIQNLRNIDVDLAAFANAHAWFLKTCTLELFASVSQEELFHSSHSTRLLCLTFKGLVDPQMANGLSASSSVAPNLLSTLSFLFDGLIHIAPRSSTFSWSDMPYNLARDAKGGAGFGIRNPFHGVSGESMEPPEFKIVSVDDFLVKADKNFESDSLVVSTRSASFLDGASRKISDLTAYNSRNRTLAGLQHLAKSLRQLLEFCFLTQTFDSVLLELGPRGGHMVVRDFLLPLLQHLGDISEMDIVIAEELISIAHYIIQRLEELIPDERSLVIDQIAQQLIVLIGRGSSRGSNYHGKVCLVWNCLRQISGETLQSEGIDREAEKYTIWVSNAAHLLHLEAINSAFCYCGYT